MKIKNDNHLYEIIDTTTGEWVTYVKTTTGYDGTTITSANEATYIDNVVYIKLNSTHGGGYAKLVYSEIDARKYGVKASSADCTAALQAAVDMAYKLGGGVVRLPAEKLVFKGTVTLYQNVSLIGQGFDNSTSPTLTTGTEIDHNPVASGTDCIIVKRDPAGFASANYAGFIMRDIKIVGDGVNSRDGVVLDTVTGILTNVLATTFSGKAFRIKVPINCLFIRCRAASSDYGFYMEPTGTVGTTISFQSCYASLNRVGAYVANCNSVDFSNWCIFESCTEEGLIADCSVSLINPYFENVTKELVKVGANGTEVEWIDIRGGAYVGGAYNDETTDLFYLDDVKFARIEAQDCRIPKSSLVRTTTNTGGLIWSGPDFVQAVSANARINSTAYTKGTKITAVCSDGNSRLFICTTAGTSAASLPTYTINATAITDGTAVFKSYGQELIYDKTKFIKIGSQSNKGRISANGFAAHYQDVAWRFEATNFYAIGDFYLIRDGQSEPLIYGNPDADRLGFGSRKISSSQKVLIDGGVEVIGSLKFNTGATVTSGVVDGANSTTISVGSASPEGSVTANVGSFYFQSNGAIWYKGTGTGNTGWVSKG